MTAVWLGLLAALAGPGCRSRPSTRPLRMGYQSSPPRQYVSPDGKPYGPTIDTVGEAGRRA
jgi:hypothetical protein